ncbi:MAG TPA: hypothetical protein VFU81_08905, partial [Thermomicrobiales bacterium]|nr:hypothetical protein [Thermomicrobiales bacterium]
MGERQSQRRQRAIDRRAKEARRIDRRGRWPGAASGDALVDTPNMGSFGLQIVLAKIGDLFRRNHRDHGVLLTLAVFAAPSGRLALAAIRLAAPVQHALRLGRAHPLNGRIPPRNARRRVYACTRSRGRDAAHAGRSEERVGHGIGDRLGAAGDVELPIEIGQMRLDCARTDEQRVGDFGVGQAAGQQAQDLELAVGEAGRIRLVLSLLRDTRGQRIDARQRRRRAERFENAARGAQARHGQIQFTVCELKFRQGEERQCPFVWRVTD